MPRMNIMDVVVGVMKDEGVAMGLSIDKINEYEPILDGARETSGQVVGGIPERD
jgi:tartronate-semialdehyde synthase